MIRIALWGAASLFVLWVLLEATAHRTEKAKLEHVFGAVAGYVVTSITVATLLAILGQYSLMRTLVCVVGLAVLVKVFGIIAWRVPVFSFAWCKSMLAQRKKPGWVTVAVAIVVLAAGAMYALFPTHYLYGGRDYGLYEINAIHIHNTGAVQYETDEYYMENYEEIKGFAMMAYPALFSAKDNGTSDSVGDLEVQFLPMLSAALAVGYGLLGFTTLMRVNALVSVLSLLALYYLAKRFFGQKTALLASFFMLVCPAQLFGARITQSEQLAQLLFLLSAYCMAIAWQKNHVGWGVAAALLFGVGGLNRIDNGALLLGLLGVACYTFLWQRSRTRLMAWVSLVSCMALAAQLWYGFTFHNAYFKDHWPVAVKQMTYICVAAAAVTVVLFLLGWLLRGRRLEDPLQMVCASPNACYTVAGVMLGAVLLTYFVRPLFNDTFWGMGIVEYSWYTSALVLPLAILGIFVLLRQSKSTLAGHALQPLLYFMLCGVGFMVMYTYKPGISPDHFWASRKWVPVNFPFLFLMAAVAIAYIWRKGARFKSKHFEKVPKLSYKLVTRSMAVVCVLVMGVQMMYQCRLFAFTKLLAGTNNQFEAVAQALPEDALVITEETQAASVLKYVFGRNVYLTQPKALSTDFTSRALSNRRFDIDSVEEYLENNESLYAVGNVRAFWQVAKVEETGAFFAGGKYPEQSEGYYPQVMQTWSLDISTFELTKQEPGTPVEYIEILSLHEFAYYLGENPDAEEDEEEVFAEGSVDPEGEYEGVQGIVVDGKVPVFYGPYVSLTKGTYRLVVTFDNERAWARANVTAGSGKKIIAEASCYGGTTIELEFTIDRATNGVEFHLENLMDSKLTCLSVTVEKLE